MRGKAILCVLLLIALVDVVSADTLIVFPEASSRDGYAQRTVSNETWNTIVNGTGTTANTNIDYAYVYMKSSGGDETGTYSINTRAGFIFNTTTIPEDATITAAEFDVRQASGSSGLGRPPLGITWYNSTATTVGSTSYQQRVDTLMSDSYLSSSSNGWKNFTLNAYGLSRINTTWYTHIQLRNQWDIENNASAIPWKGYGNQTLLQYYAMDYGSNIPQLTIQYTTGDTTPPASITDLANSTTCNSINWTWTDSVSDDADVVQIYQNGTFLHNVSANQTYDLWESLAESLEYTFSSHTCDLTGNCNTTWVNQTAETIVCPDTTPPAIPTGVSVQ